MRLRNTNAQGASFSPIIVGAVWQKARIDFQYDRSTDRRDKCNHLIKKADHGSQTQYGWEVVT
jgi:hypothetical protein